MWEFVSGLNVIPCSVDFPGRPALFLLRQEGGSGSGEKHR